MCILYVQKVLRVEITDALRDRTDVKSRGIFHTLFAASEQKKRHDIFQSNLALTP